MKYFLLPHNVYKSHGSLLLKRFQIFAAGLKESLNEIISPLNGKVFIAVDISFIRGFFPPGSKEKTYSSCVFYAW